MTNTVKIYNKGKSVISGKGFALKPEACMEFDEKTGTYLKKLYPGILVDMASIEKQFDAAAAKTATPGTAPAAPATPPAAGSIPPAAPAQPEANKEGFVAGLVNKVAG